VKKAQKMNDYTKNQVGMRMKKQKKPPNI